MFTLGDRVRLVERLRAGVDAVGIVVGFGNGDVIVRWGNGLEAALSLASVERTEDP